MVLGQRRPEILIEFGSVESEMGVAKFVKVHNDSVLEFVYIVQQDDKNNFVGLYLRCGCSDYFNRTSIRVFDSAIVAIFDAQLSASLVLVNRESKINRLINPYLRFNTVPPRVLSVSTNLTSGVYYPGDAVEISVSFSSRVTVIGSIKLRLWNPNGHSIAHFTKGNNSRTLQFSLLLYVHSVTSNLN